jgi:hypothetical protein
MTNIAGSGLDLVALLLQLQSMTTAHSQWLLTTRSITFWTIECLLFLL